MNFSITQWSFKNWPFTGLHSSSLGQSIPLRAITFIAMDTNLTSHFQVLGNLPTVQWRMQFFLIIPVSLSEHEFCCCQHTMLIVSQEMTGSLYFQKHLPNTQTLITKVCLWFGCKGCSMKSRVSPGYNSNSHQHPPQTTASTLEFYPS